MEPANDAGMIRVKKCEVRLFFWDPITTSIALVFRIQAVKASNSPTPLLVQDSDSVSHCCEYINAWNSYWLVQSFMVYVLVLDLWDFDEISPDGAIVD